jgi:hypothetical protein
MIPPLAHIIRCPGTIDHRRLSEILTHAEARQFAHVPLLRAALMSQIQIVMPQWQQTVPLEEDKDPDLPTVVYLDACAGWANEPKDWACGNGIVRWARFVLILGASHTHEHPFERARYLGTRLKRAAIVRVADSAQEEWETAARVWNPGCAISFRPHPHHITAEEVVPINPYGDSLKGVIKHLPELRKEEVIKLACGLEKSDSEF